VTRPLRILPRALMEIDAAAIWYADRRAGLGTQFLHEVDVMIDRVTAAPQRFARARESERYRRALLHRFPYALFFRANTKEIVVVSVSHTSRRPGFWLTRSEE
jgi:plasmid stabilization system protein ParE